MKNYVKEYKGLAVPEGATHYNEANMLWPECFIDVKYGRVHEIGGGGWMLSSKTMPITAIELPEVDEKKMDYRNPLPKTVQEWDGRVGSMTGCWVNSSPVDGPSEWRECLVKFSDRDSNIIVVRFKGDDKDTPIKLPYRFVPLKTQQEKDREEFICKSLSLYPLLIPTNDLRELLGVSFDNGARFPEGEIND